MLLRTWIIENRQTSIENLLSLLTPSITFFFSSVGGSGTCTQHIAVSLFITRNSKGPEQQEEGKQKLGNAPLSSAFYQWICCWTETRHLEKLFGYLALSQESCTWHTRANGAGAQRRHQAGLVASQSQSNLIYQTRWIAAEVQPGQTREGKETNIMF